MISISVLTLYVYRLLSSGGLVIISISVLYRILSSGGLEIKSIFVAFLL